MIEKMFRMLLDLVNKDMVTAKELSQKLEISERTVYRYIDKLSLSNIPIYTVAGKGGGICIGEEFKLQTVHLTNDEKDMIITSLSALDGGKNIKAMDIAGKINALKRTGQRGEYCKNVNFLVDSSSSPNDTVIQTKINSVTYALEKKTALSVNYRSRQGVDTERVIEPYTLVYRDSVWYAYCYCRLRNQMRMFKVSRMTHIRLTDSRYEIKTHSSDWDLEDKDKPEQINLIMEVNKDALYNVEEWLGVENVRKKENSENYIAESTVLDNDATLSKIFGFGKSVQILSPDSLKKKLLEKCKRILSN